MKKIGWVLILALIIVFISSEFILRTCFGFCHAPLYVESSKYEYICAPNQNIYRFGNHIIYNSYSQRSDEPDTSKFIILGLGDSVMNGGVQTDNKDLATSILSEEKGVQMLNISAGSWGPDNCFAYLKEHGLFNAKAIVLVVSSHDAYDNMDFQPVVGVHKSYPKQQYSLAWVELFDRYLLPRFQKVQTEDPDQQVLAGIDINKAKNPHVVKKFNIGFDSLKSLAEENSIPLCIYLHPDRKEFAAHSYNQQGLEIITWAKENNIPICLGINKEVESGFRDGIHINKEGQKRLAQSIRNILIEQKILQ